MSRKPVVAAIGMATLDYLYLVDQYPREDSVAPARERSFVLGGPAGRAAIAAGRLGARVKLMAMIGNDTHSEVLRTMMAQEPVETSWFAVDQPGQHSFVLAAADTGSRTIVWTPQPGADQQILDAVDEMLSDADVALLDCTDPTLSQHAVEACRKKAVPIVMDTGSYRRWSEDFLKGADYLIAPEKFFTVRHPETELSQALKIVAEDFEPKVVAATRGDRGGVYLQGTEVHTYSADKIDVVDSSGAGDAFHGGFAWAIASGLPVPLSFQVASWVAGQKCGAVGNENLPGARELDAFLAAQKPTS